MEFLVPQGISHRLLAWSFFVWRLAVNASGVDASPVGGSQACLEKDVHPWVGSTDPTPITMYFTANLRSKILDFGGL